VATAATLRQECQVALHLSFIRPSRLLLLKRCGVEQQRLRLQGAWQIGVEAEAVVVNRSSLLARPPLHPTRLPQRAPRHQLRKGSGERARNERKRGLRPQQQQPMLETKTSPPKKTTQLPLTTVFLL
jgi:hypothetical protein